MSDKEFDFLVFIGRFQPFHKGHLSVIEEAYKRAHNVIVLVGSANSPRTQRNPFTFDERREMIRSSLPGYYPYVQPLNDHTYNNAMWVADVQQTVEMVIQDCSYVNIEEYTKGDMRIGLIGHSKDNSSFYLNEFPQWESVDVPDTTGLSSTPIREELLEFGWLTGFDEREDLTKAVAEVACRVYSSGVLNSTITEFKWVKRYREEWVFKDPTKPLPSFATTDAVVIQSGHILLIQRRNIPGKGLWALPGGFLHSDETTETGMIRELREETCLRVPVPVLKGNITKKEVFDDPFRSDRGRIITTAFLIELPGEKEGLPKVKGADDARNAKWVPLSEVSPSIMFEDHYHIIRKMVGN